MTIEASMEVQEEDADCSVRILIAKMTPDDKFQTTHIHHIHPRLILGPKRSCHVWGQSSSPQPSPQLEVQLRASPRSRCFNMFQQQKSAQNSGIPILGILDCTKSVFSYFRKSSVWQSSLKPLGTHLASPFLSCRAKPTATGTRFFLGQSGLSK